MNWEGSSKEGDMLLEVLNRYRTVTIFNVMLDGKNFQVDRKLLLRNMDIAKEMSL